MNGLVCVLIAFIYIVATIAATAFASQKRLVNEYQPLIAWVLYIIFWPIIILYNIFYTWSRKIPWGMNI